MPVLNQADLRPFSMLRAGGSAEFLTVARSRDELACVVAGRSEVQGFTILGFGSNVLVSDQGIPGLTVVNRCRSIEYEGDGVWNVDCGVWLQDLVLKTAQRGFSGLEFAVGIPGSVGGALVSNAGAYRSSIAEHVVEIEIIDGYGPRWVNPSFLQFAYRDSLLRQLPSLNIVLAGVRLKLNIQSQGNVFARMRDFQAQRIKKQPLPASAGSFFKNVYNFDLAESLPQLPAGMKESGVVPAGFLIEACGLKGFRKGRASIGNKHSNFIINDRGASSTEIRTLAEFVKRSVRNNFGVDLIEEVLYIGDWSAYRYEEQK